jgi:uncharacterized membrane protein
MNWRTLIANPALLSGLVRAVFLVAVSFGISITQSQQDGILTLVGAVISVLGSLTMTAVTIANTTPTAAPVVPQGTTITVVTPAGQPDYRARV